MRSYRYSLTVSSHSFPSLSLLGSVSAPSSSQVVPGTPRASIRGPDRQSVAAIGQAVKCPVQSAPGVSSHAA